LKACTFPQKCRSVRSGIRMRSIHSCSVAYRLTISSVPSVEPSLTMTHFAGCTVCPTTDLMVSSMNLASFLAAVMRT